MLVDEPKPKDKPPPLLVIWFVLLSPVLGVGDSGVGRFLFFLFSVGVSGVIAGGEVRPISVIVGSG